MNKKNPRGAKFKVTGKWVYTNRNFPPIYTNNLMHAKGINLWRGNVWEWDSRAKQWRKLWEVYN